MFIGTVVALSRGLVSATTVLNKPFGRVWHSFHQRHYLGDINLDEVFVGAMSLESLRGGPPLNQQKGLGVGLRMVDLEALASRFRQ